MNKYFSLLLLLITGASFGGGHEDHGHAESGDIHLSPELRALLVQEMNEIEKGMESLVLSVASGNWHEIETTGNNIRNSYILKNKLTPQQKHELHETLPAAFNELDMKFHYYAGMLSHVAREKDIELVHYFVYKMNEACTSCHAKFASRRFSGLKHKNIHAEHRH